MHKHRTVLFLVFAVLALGGTSLLTYRAFLWRKGLRILNHVVLDMDSRAVLAAGRQMIEQRTSYQSADPAFGELLGGAVVLWPAEQHLEAQLPEAIRLLSPEDIHIYEGCVEFGLHAPPRISLVAFAEGVPEKGNVKLTNGLWLCADYIPPGLLAEKARRDDG